MVSHSQLSFLLPLTAPCTPRSTKLAAALGCKSNPAKLEECLQQADPGKITLMQSEVLTQPALLGLSFVPTVDGVFLTNTVEVHLQLCSCCCHIQHFSTFQYQFYSSPSFENVLHHKHQTIFFSPAGAAECR